MTERRIQISTLGTPRVKSFVRYLTPVHRSGTLECSYLFTERSTYHKDRYIGLAGLDIHFEATTDEANGRTGPESLMC